MSGFPDEEDNHEAMMKDARIRQAHREQRLSVQEAARYVVQTHARMQDSEAALIAAHGELDKAREGNHSRVAAMLVGFTAAARRAVRHYRRLEDGGIVDLRMALGLSAIPTREEIGLAVPDASQAEAEPTDPGIAENTPTRDENDDGN